MYLERKTAKFVQLLLGDVQAFLAREKIDVEDFSAFARAIYPRVHSAFYSTILSPADQWFVRKNGLDILFDCPLTTGEDDYLPGERKRRITTVDPVTVAIAQADCRLLYKLVNDLNLCFKDWQENSKRLDAAALDAFISRFASPVAESLEVLQLEPGQELPTAPEPASEDNP